MIEVRRYIPAEAERWDGFVRGSRMPRFMFERGFMDYHQDRFEDFSLMFFRDDELIAVLPASRHGVELRSHGGLTYGGMIYGEKMKQHTMLECFDALKFFCKTSGVESILYKNIPHIYHSQPAEEDLYALYKNGAELLKIEPATVVHLKHPYKMPKGRKAQIARAKREGVIVQCLNDFARFIELENKVLISRHGVRAVHTSAEIEKLHLQFPENIRCIGAFYDGNLVAGTLLFVYDKVIHTQYLAANDIAREIGALDLIILKIMDECRNTHEFLDFGISSENGGRILNEGLIAQKEGFGGRTIAYQTWRSAL